MINVNNSYNEAVIFVLILEDMIINGVTLCTAPQKYMLDGSVEFPQNQVYIEIYSAFFLLVFEEESLDFGKIYPMGVMLNFFSLIFISIFGISYSSAKSFET